MARQISTYRLVCYLEHQFTVTSKRIRIQASSTIPQSLVKRLSNFVAEVTILLDPLQNQISILQYWRRYINDLPAGNVATLDMYDEAIKAREAHLVSFQRLLDQGKNTQALVSKLAKLASPLRQHADVPCSCSS